MDMYQEEDIPEELQEHFIEAPQIGLEDTPVEFVKDLMEVFREVKRVLKPTGTFYLNIDDTYSRGSRNKDGSEDSMRDEDAGEPVKEIEYSVPDKCMSMVPEKLAMAMVEEGYILRNKIIWTKKNPLPESVKDRYSTKWEYVYMFSLNQNYYFDLDSIREPHKQNSIERANRGVGDHKWREGVPGQEEHTGLNDNDGEERLHPEGKNPGDVWEISTKSFSEAHFAVFPEELTEKPIKSSVPKKVCENCGVPYEREVEREEQGATESRHDDELDGLGQSGLKWDGPANAEVKGWKKQCDCDTEETDRGIILDPFAGAGTTLLSARRHNRDYIGIELNKEFVEIAKDRIKKETGGKSIQDYI